MLRCRSRYQVYKGQSNSMTKTFELFPYVRVGWALSISKFKMMDIKLWHVLWFNE